MKKLVFILSSTLALLALAALQAAPPGKSCVSHISDWADSIGEDGKEVLSDMRNVLKEAPFGKGDKFQEPKFATSFLRTFTLLSEILDDIPTEVSREGVKGFSHTTTLLFRPGATADGTTLITNHSAKDLLDSCTMNGSLQGAKFDAIMRQINETNFDFDPDARTATLKKSGLIIGDGPKAPHARYNQGEYHALTHILKGHTLNDFTAGTNKSLFSDPEEIFNLVEDLWESPDRVLQQVRPDGTHIYTVDFGPQKQIGTSGETKLLIYVKGQNLESAHPFQ